MSTRDLQYAIHCLGTIAVLSFFGMWMLYANMGYGWKLGEPATFQGIIELVLPPVVVLPLLGVLIGPEPKGLLLMIVSSSTIFFSGCVAWLHGPNFINGWQLGSLPAFSAALLCHCAAWMTFAIGSLVLRRETSQAT